MKQLLFLLALIFIVPELLSQEKLFDISVHGFVAVDAAYNSRASNEVRNKHIYLYPLPKNIENGVDLNNQGAFDIDAAHSRLSLHVKGPTFQGVSVFGMIEADFLGSSPTSDTNLRLRQAYIQLGYKDFDFIAGQTWHPFFIPEYYPRTLNANVGAPIHPLSRNPQLRISHTITPSLKWSLMVIEQNNFRSVGFPDGSEKSNFPEVDLQIQLGGSGNFRAALTAGYKQLAVTRPEENAVWTKRPIVEGIHFQSNFFISLPKLVVRTGGVYGDNLTEHIMPGGVGLLQSSDPINKPEYIPLSVFSTWLDINSKSTKWDPGLFVGYLKNLGASDKISVEEDLSRDPRLANIWVISPRLRYHVTPQACVGLEYSYTQAGWGELNQFDDYGKPQNVENFHNHRTLLSVRYNF